MPTIIKLPPEEVRSIQDKGKSQRQRIAEQYDVLLADFAVGDWGDVALDPDDKRPTVRGRLGAAAERRGFGLRFARGSATMMRFQVVAPGEAEVEDVAGGTEEPYDATAEAAPLIVEPEPIEEANNTMAEAVAPIVDPEPEAAALIVDPEPEAAPIVEAEPKQKRGGRKKKEVSPSPEPIETAAPARRGGRKKKEKAPASPEPKTSTRRGSRPSEADA